MLENIRRVLKRVGSFSRGGVEQNYPGVYPDLNRANTLIH